MAVLGRLLVSSAERLDLPDFLSIDSYTQGDFKYLMKSFVGSDKPFILKGFDVINPGNAIGTQNISIRIADSVVYYPGSSAGPFFHGLEEGNILAAPLVPELRKNSTNYVYLTLTTVEAAKDTRAFWDPDKNGGAGGEFTQDVNTQTVLSVDVNVSVSSFPENTIPVCKVVVGPNFIESITDARDMMFRLGSGGLNPNPLTRYNWRSEPFSAYKRQEPNPTMTSALDPNPFQGGDKNIQSLKEWMDAIMTKLAELGGTTYWYEDTSVYNLINVFKDALATSIKSKGFWNSSDVTVGLLSWSEDITIQSTSDLSQVIIRSGNKTIADNEVMFIEKIRDKSINTGNIAVDWFNGADYINGQLGSFENLSKGDWIKKADDSDNLFLRVEEFYAAPSKSGGITAPGNALSIKLSGAYAGISETKFATYTKGVYLASEVQVASRNDTSIQDAAGNFYWLAMRSDTILNVSSIVTTQLSIDISGHDGVRALVTSVGHGLSDGQRIKISGSTNFNGTFAVSVETANTFYIDISGGPFADETGQSAFFATVTTTSRSTVDGLLLESANHGLAIDQRVVISNTTNYNGDYQVFPKSATTFTIPVSTLIASESSGLSTTINIYVRTDIGPTLLERGENKVIGQTETQNIMSFIGMDNDAQLHPNYYVPSNYGTLYAKQNYNSDSTEGLTHRVSKLTSMIADKAQDKTINKSLVGVKQITNVTAGLIQNVTFIQKDVAVPMTLTLSQPSSPGNCVLTFDSVIALGANQAAYITIDRNASSALLSSNDITVANISNVPLNENVFIVLFRLNGTDVYLWDGTPINDFLNATGTAVAEKTTITPVADVAGSLTNKYFTLNSASDETQYYVWFNISGAAVDPAPPGLTGIEVPILINATANDIATAMQGVIDLLPDFSVVDNTGSITITNTAVGATTDAADTGLTGFGISVDIQGAGEVLHYIADGDLDKTAIKKLDKALDDEITSVFSSLAETDARVAQNKTIKLIKGGTWYWDQANNTLNLSDNAYIQIAQLADDRNTILSGNITLNAGEIAYVSINRTTDVPTNLTVFIGTMATLTNDNDTFIIARRVDNNVYLSNGISLQPGERIELDAVLAEVNKFLRRLELKPVPSNPKRLQITTPESTMLDGSKVGQVISSLMMDPLFSAQIDPVTGNIYKGDGVTALGQNFAPPTIAPSQYRWFGVSIIPSGVNLIGEMEAQVLVLVATADGATPATATKEGAVLGGEIPVGWFYVQRNALDTDIEDIGYANIVRALASGGGSGSGSGTSLLTRLEDFLTNSFYEWLVASDFSLEQNTKIASGTAGYSYADKAYSFSAGQNIQTISLLDTRFLQNLNDVLKVSVALVFKQGAVDPTPTITVTNNGVDFQVVTMERLIEDDDTFYGTLDFNLAALILQTIEEYALANEDSQVILNNTSILQVSQQIQATQYEVAEQLTVSVTKLGSPTGVLYINLHDDNAGQPGVIKSQSRINIADLVAGQQNVTVKIGRQVLGQSSLYHLSLSTDAEYKGTYNAGVDQIAIGADSSAPTVANAQAFDGSTWLTLSGISIVGKVEGRVLNLIMTYTASTDALLVGFGVYYGESATTYERLNKRAAFVFHGTNDNLNQFQLPWDADPDFIEVQDRISGQVWGAPSFELQNNKVVFPVNFFDGRETVYLVAKQVEAGSYDGNPELKKLVTENHLGSVDPMLDRSSPGRGPKVRTETTALLVEITVDENYNLVIKEA